MATEDKNGNLHDENGRFTEKSASELKQELQQELPDRDKPSSRGKSKSQEEFFGEEFKGVKGMDAIDKLLQEKRGHVKNAFERPEIGGIDLVWGDEHGGLFHTIKKRDRLLEKGIGNISGLDMARKIPEIIEKGEFSIDEHSRPNFIYEKNRLVVKPTYDGIKLNWVITAMEILQ